MLLLDEPMAGMNVEEKQDMSRFILDVNDEFGTTIVLIEHDMGVVMDLSDRVVVLDYGRKIADGTPGRGARQPGGDRRLPRGEALMSRHEPVPEAMDAPRVLRAARDRGGGAAAAHRTRGSRNGSRWCWAGSCRACSIRSWRSGLVLIFKASGVFNFAQGAMVLFAALSLVRLMEKMPFVVALALTIAIMVALAWLIERLVLRRLVNQDPIVLFMATLGIAYFLDGFGQTVWGSDIYTLNVGMPKEPKILLEGTFEGGILVDMEDVIAAAMLATVMVAVLALFFQKTGTGRALRAVADDHQAAQSIGIPLNRIWVIVWSVAGMVALVAGIIWGSKLGVQFSLQLVALKALPS